MKKAKLNLSIGSRQKNNIFNNSLMWTLISKKLPSAKIFCCLLLMLGNFFICLATTYYVDPSGDDTNGDGSAGSPWGTIAYAASQVSTFGDTIHLNAGTYTESYDTYLPPGVNLEGDGEDSTIIRPVETSEDSRAYVVRVVSSSIVDGNQKLSNFTVDGRNHALRVGLYIKKRNNITVENVTVKDCHLRALHLYGDTEHGLGWDDWPNTRPNDSYFISGCVIKNCTFKNSGRPVSGKTWDYATVDWNTVKDSKLIGCYIDETTYGGFGAKLWHIKNCIIANNVVRVAASDVDRGKDFSIESWFADHCQIFDNDVNGAFSIPFNDTCYFGYNRIIHGSEEEIGYGFEWGGSDSILEHNYIQNAGIAIACWTWDNTSSRISHNIICDSYTAIMLDCEDTDYFFDNYMIYNNTIDYCNDRWNEGPIGFRIQDSSCTIESCDIKNNIVSNTQGNEAGITLTGVNGSSLYVENISDTTISYNLFYNNANGNIDDLGATNTTQSNNSTSNPLYQASGSDIFYYQLGSTSPALESGTDVGLPYLGTAPDQGAFIQDATERIEAEMNYSVAEDSDSDINVAAATLSSNDIVRCIDSSDKIRIHFYLPEARTYRMKCRVKSGISGDDDSYFANGSYSFKLDFDEIDFSGDDSSISAYDSTNGGCYWGTMKSNDYINFPAGLHHLEISGSQASRYIDYLELETPLLDMPFNEGSGTPADISDNSNTVTMTGPSWTVNGYINSALVFEDLSDRVYVSGDVVGALDATGHWAVEAWIKISSAPSWRKIIASQESYSNNGFRWGIDSSRRLIFWTTQSGGSITLTSGSNYVDLDTWAHVKVDYNNGTTSLYINDSQVGQTTSGSFVPCSQIFRVGYCGGAENFNGIIDEVKILIY